MDERATASQDQITDGRENLAALWRKLEVRLSRPQWLIVLDRDGTLVPIVDRPEGAVINDELKSVIADLSLQPRTQVAIISARGLEQLRKDFGTDSLILSGNYGLEIAYFAEEARVQLAARQAVPLLQEFKTRAHQLIAENKDIILEDHGYSLCLHWHLVPAALQAAVHAVIAKLKADLPKLKFRHLPTSYEIVPLMDWDKSYALTDIADRLCPEGSGATNDHFYFYAGDADADEPAFKWVNQRSGVSVRIGAAGAGYTEATDRLDNPDQLAVLLAKLLAWRKENQ